MCKATPIPSIAHNCTSLYYPSPTSTDGPNPTTIVAKHILDDYHTSNRQVEQGLAATAIVTSEMGEVGKCLGTPCLRMVANIK